MLWPGSPLLRLWELGFLVGPDLGGAEELRLCPGAWPVGLAGRTLRDSWLGFSPLWPQLSKVNSFTLCRRLLKSWTPRELELGGVVSWAAICWLRALASFRSFSVILVFRPNAVGRDRGLVSKRECSATGVHRQTGRHTDGHHDHLFSWNLTFTQGIQESAHGLATTSVKHSLVSFPRLTGPSFGLLLKDTVLHQTKSEHLPLELKARYIPLSSLTNLLQSC
jgi:hypothetical protein